MWSPYFLAKSKLTRGGGVDSHEKLFEPGVGVRLISEKYAKKYRY